MDVGALTPPLWGFEEREKLMGFYERASGARMHANYFRVGGVHQDLPSKLLDDIWAFCDPFLQVCDDLEGLLTENRIFKQRNVNIGVVSLVDAWAWGFSGVMVRGSGATWDLRKAQPYECYSELDFDVPVGKHGDCYDRYFVRMDEMRQSVRIMRQCLERLCSPEGQGPVVVKNQHIVPPRREVMKRSMEAIIEHFKLYTEGFRVPRGEIYQQSKPRRENSKFIWCQMAQTGPTSARSVLLRSLTCRPWTFCPADTCSQTYLRSLALWMLYLVRLTGKHLIRDFRLAKAKGVLTQVRYRLGASVDRATRISKNGNPVLRAALYMPALSAMRYNPAIVALATGLKSRGRLKPKQIVVAAMRKLLVLCFGVPKQANPSMPRLRWAVEPHQGVDRMADIGWGRRRGSSPAVRRGAQRYAGLTHAFASNTLPCQHELLHSKQLRSIKKSH